MKTILTLATLLTLALATSVQAQTFGVTVRTQNGGLPVERMRVETGVAVGQVLFTNAYLTIDNQQVLQFREAGGLNYAALRAPAALAADYTLTLPPDDGAAGQLLATDGSGNLSWFSPSSTTPFSAITTATNNSAAMTVGAGASILAGGGTVQATEFLGTGSTTSAVDLATAEVAGTLPIARGGTNSGAALGGSSIMISDGTSIVQGAAGTATTVLHGNAAGAPTYGAVNLTADVTGTLPVGSGGTGTATAFTPGSVVFAGAAGVYSQDNANLFWDDATNRLGIGTATPAQKLYVNSTTNSDGITFNNSTGNDSYFRFLENGSVGGMVAYYGASDSLHVGATAAAGYVTLDTNLIERMRVTSAGNVGIGTAAPATTLDVNGVVNAATGYRVANAAAAGNYLRGNGTNFVGSTIQAADIPAGSGNYLARNAADASSAAVAAGYLYTFSNTSATATGGLQVSAAASSTARAIQGTGGQYGVYGTVGGATDNASGLFGWNTSTGAGTQIGAYGAALGVSTLNIGVFGTSNLATGSNVGVQGRSSGSSPNNRGVYGLADGGAGAKYGVFGEATGAGTTNYGLFATASGATTNWAGFFADDVRIGDGAGTDRLSFSATSGVLQVGAFTAGAPATGDMRYNAGNLEYYNGSWQTLGVAGGGTAFSAITSGINATAAMTVGAGASIVAGGGSIQATEFLGTGSTTNAVDLATAEVAGTLPIGSGGTNATTIGAAGTVSYSTGTAYASSAAGAAGQILHSGGAGVPTWSAVNLASATEVTGTLPVGSGGTGIASSGAAGNYLRSTGAVWASSAIQAADIPAGSANYLARNATDTSSAAVAGGYLYTFSNTSAAADSSGLSVSTVGGGSNNRGVNVSAGGAGTDNRGINVSASGATGTNYGIDANVSGVGAAANYGHRVVVGNATANYGVYSVVAGASGSNYFAGFFDVQVLPAGVGSTSVYASSQATTAATHYALRGSATGATGTGTKYAVYGSATGTATTNCGVYGTASGGTTNWAGFFADDVRIGDGAGTDRLSFGASGLVQIGTFTAGAPAAGDMRYSGGNLQYYNGAWQTLGVAGGTLFSAITTDTNTTATMTVGAGASIMAGGGTIQATQFLGTGSTTSAVDLATAEVAGTLPIARGGTNSGAALAGSSIMISNGSAIVQGALGTTTTVLHGNAAGAPTYGAVSLTADVAGTLPVGSGGTNSAAALNNNRIMVSSGGAIVEAAALTNGQLLIGSTGAAPVAAALTGAANQVSVTNGAGSVTLGYDYTATTAANPALAANATVFGTNGVLFEGATNDLLEGVLSPAALTADQTWTLPDATGTVVLSSTMASTAFVQSGNSFAATATLGTNDAFALGFETGGLEKMRLQTDGTLSIGTVNDGAYRIYTENPGAALNGAYFWGWGVGQHAVRADHSGGSYAYLAEGQYGTRTLGTFYGVWATTAGGVGPRYGVYGQANNLNPGEINYGVYGTTGASAGTNYGVYGTTGGGAGTNWAGYFAGNMNVTGDLYTGGTLRVSSTGVVGSGGANATWNGVAVGAAYGGTGLNTSAAATGSLLYTSAVGTWSTLGAGAVGTVLTSNGAGVAPSWQAAGSGANTSLSNLVATSVNQSLVPNANNTLDLGSSALAWRTAYLATSASFGTTATKTTLNYTAPTAARTITLPDASGTVAVSASGNIALSAAGNVTFTGTLPVGSGGTGTATALTAGSVVFAGAGGVYSQDNANFFWNDASNLLGIGTNAPVENLHVIDSAGSTGSYASGSDLLIDSGAAQRYITMRGPNSGQTGILFSNSDGFVDGGIRYWPSAVAGSDRLELMSGGTGAVNVLSNGNVGIGTSAPGYRLDAQGGDINTSADVRAGDEVRFPNQNDTGVKVNRWTGSVPGAGVTTAYSDAWVSIGIASDYRLVFFPTAGNDGWWDYSSYGTVNNTAGSELDPFSSAGMRFRTDDVSTITGTWYYCSYPLSTFYTSACTVNLNRESVATAPNYVVHAHLNGGVMTITVEVYSP